jgi:hypothetical protein
MKHTKKSPAISIVTGFQKYKLTIFIVVLVGGLATAVLFLNQILALSSDTTGYTSTLEVQGFDQVTIERIQQLQPSSEPAPVYVAPAGRVNPFTE